jgi:hypothetical protein
VRPITGAIARRPRKGIEPSQARSRRSEEAPLELQQAARKRHMTPQLARGIGPVLAQCLPAPRGCGLAWVRTEDARVGGHAGAASIYPRLVVPRSPSRIEVIGRETFGSCAGALGGGGGDVWAGGADLGGCEAGESDTTSSRSCRRRDLCGRSTSGSRASAALPVREAVSEAA